MFKRLFKCNHKWITRQIKGGTIGLVYQERYCLTCKEAQEHWKFHGWIKKGIKPLSQTEFKDKYSGKMI